MIDALENVSVKSLSTHMHFGFESFIQKTKFKMRIIAGHRFRTSDLRCYLVKIVWSKKWRRCLDSQ